MAITPESISKIAEKKTTVLTILPGTTVFLGKKDFAPARSMLDEGVKVAIGSDFNPGSCNISSTAFMMSLAMQNCKMNLEEAFRGVTRNAALSLKRKRAGLFVPGARADMLVWSFDSLDQIPYYNFTADERITHFVRGRVMTR